MKRDHPRSRDGTSRTLGKMKNMDPPAPVIRRLIAPAWAIWEIHPVPVRLSPVVRTRRLRRKCPPPSGESPATARPRLPYHRFWRTRFDEAGLRPEKICSFDDFRQVPLLTKSDLRPAARIWFRAFSTAPACFAADIRLHRRARRSPARRGHQPVQPGLCGSIGRMERMEAWGADAPSGVTRPGIPRPRVARLSPRLSGIQ